MSIIKTINITKSFPGVIALDRVNISCEKGKIHCIIGENGAGKSTLIKILTGIYKPEIGDVFIEGENALENPILFDIVAYVPQELDQFEHMTVADNLFIPYEKSGISNKLINKKELNKRTISWLEKFQISASPAQLVKDLPISDQQMLQVARAMVNFNLVIISPLIVPKIAPRTKVIIIAIMGLTPEYTINIPPRIPHNAAIFPTDKSRSPNINRQDWTIAIIPTNERSRTSD